MNPKMPHMDASAFFLIAGLSCGTRATKLMAIVAIASFILGCAGYDHRLVLNRNVENRNCSWSKIEPVNRKFYAEIKPEDLLIYESNTRVMPLGNMSEVDKKSCS